MKYYKYLKHNKKDITQQLENLFLEYKVEPVGSGYIDCIVRKDNLEGFVKGVASLGIIINNCGWWCYVDSNNSDDIGCPHGMGGPKSIYYEGWYSELQNDFYSIHDSELEVIMHSYDKELVYTINMQMIDGIINKLKEPFRYTPTEYIEGNKCVTPSLWLLVPDDWIRI